MLTKIMERLREGSIGSVIRDGDVDAPPTAPYVCLKTETNPIGRTIRVIAHYAKGFSKDLELYIFNEVVDLLSNWSYTDEYGNYVTVKDAKEYTDIITDNDDSTISMERLFYIPLIL